MTSKKCIDANRKGILEPPYPNFSYFRVIGDIMNVKKTDRKHQKKYGDEHYDIQPICIQEILSSYQVS